MYICKHNIIRLTMLNTHTSTSLYTVRPSFRSGVLSLFGATRRRVRVESDTAALRRDWEAVGECLREAMREMETRR